MKKLEKKEKLSKEEFAMVLRELAEAVENSKDYETKVNDSYVLIPANGEMKMEYELKADKGELSLEYKWRNIAKPGERM